MGYRIGVGQAQVAWGQPLLARYWGNGFLPGKYQGVQFRSTGDAVLYVSNPDGIDPATRRNLELTQTLRGEAAPTLLSLLDTTVTAGGARLLRAWLSSPLRDHAVPRSRHLAVAEAMRLRSSDAIRAGVARRAQDAQRRRAAIEGIRDEALLVGKGPLDRGRPVLFVGREPHAGCVGLQLDLPRVGLGLAGLNHDRRG